MSSDTLEIDGKLLHPIKEASELVSYSRDYVTRLAREKKIVASYVGRQWFVDLKSLQSYVEAIILEQEIRKKQLSAERKRENQIREAVKQQHTLHLKKIKTLHVKSVAVASLVLVFGLATGLIGSQLISFLNPLPVQVANTFDTQEIQSPDKVALSETSSDNFYYDENSSPTHFQKTEELHSIGDIQNGILLLPEGDKATIEVVLSDKVIVRELSDGTKVVVRVDANGREIGNEIPFVTVPVEHKKVPI